MRRSASISPRHGTADPGHGQARCPWHLRLRLCLGYAAYHLSKGIFVAAAIPLLLVLLPFPRTKHRVLGGITHRYLAWLSRGLLPALGVYRVAEISGAARARAARPAVYVANHRGRMDGPLLLGLLPHTGVVLKAREGRQWSFALLMQHFDLVPIGVGPLNRLRQTLDRARRVLAEGRSLLLFPEGTRAKNGRLQAFHPLAFQLAREAGVPIVPVVVHSVLPFMGRISGSYFPPAPNVFRVRFLDPEPVRPEDDPRELGDRIRRRLARELEGLDVGTVWVTTRTPSHEPAPSLPT